MCKEAQICYICIKGTTTLILLMAKIKQPHKQGAKTALFLYSYLSFIVSMSWIMALSCLCVKPSVSITNFGTVDCFPKR